jgi:hypothetical protein
MSPLNLFYLALFIGKTECPNSGPVADTLLSTSTRASKSTGKMLILAVLNLTLPLIETCVLDFLNHLSSDLL